MSCPIILGRDGACPSALIPVMVGLERALDRNSQIIGLCLRELGEFYSDLLQMQASDFFIEFFRQNVNADFVGVPILPKIELREHLVGK